MDEKKEEISLFLKGSGSLTKSTRIHSTSTNEGIDNSKTYIGKKTIARQKLEKYDIKTDIINSDDCKTDI